YQRDYIDLNVLGRTASIYLRRTSRSEIGRSSPVWPRLGASLGVFYLLAFLPLLWIFIGLCRPAFLILEGGAGTVLILAFAGLSPERVFFRSPLRQPYSGRTSGILRLIYYTWILVALGLMRLATGGGSAFYFWVLWVVPLITTFPYYMLLRDIY